MKSFKYYILLVLIMSLDEKTASILMENAYSFPFGLITGIIGGAISEYVCDKHEKRIEAIKNENLFLGITRKSTLSQIGTASLLVYASSLASSSISGQSLENSLINAPGGVAGFVVGFKLARVLNMGITGYKHYRANKPESLTA